MSDFTPAPALTWRDQKVPVSEQFDDVYFSQDNGLEETRYVFIEGNQLLQSASERLVVAETGFGTGLNFLATWQAWQQAADKPLLHFVSVEKYPLTKAQLRQALSCWPELTELASQLLEQYPEPISESVNRLVFECGRVHLTLLFDDAIAGFKQLAQIDLADERAGFGKPVTVDAWYLDGFAPAKNSDMWRPELFQAMASLSHVGTRLATFTAAGFVRRGLQAVGFRMQKRKGFGSKREMLVGELIATANEQNALPLATAEQTHGQKTRYKGPPPRIPHWARVSEPALVQTVAIIGAGLAGCHSALSLARRGLQVTVFDKGQVASGASGNPQGVLYTRPSHHDDIFARFNALALDYAHAFYQGFDDNYLATGVVHLGFDAKYQALNQQVLARFQNYPAIAESIARDDINQRFGGEVATDGIFSAKGGAIYPAQLCRALLNHPNIRVCEYTDIQAISRQQGAGWALTDTRGDAGTFDALVLANAYSASEFTEAKGLRLNPIRGQMNSLRLAAPSRLSTSLCSEGYVAPARKEGKHWQLSFGATFTLKQDPSDLATFKPSDACTAKNLATLAGLLGPQFVEQAVASGELSARVSYRCATRDYLPLVGPLANVEQLLERFAKLRKNANARIEANCPNYPNLYINVGHGSRGLAYTPVCAEVLASLICGEPLPLDDALYPHLHPARFYIRDLIRNKL